MLKAMRKNLKALAPTLWIVIAAFIIAIFAVWGGAGRLGEGAKDQVIATVGDEKIPVDFYYETLRQRLEAMKREFKELNKSLIQQLNIPQQVLEQMIQQSLLSQVAGDMGLSVSDAEIREKIRSYPVFQRDGAFIGFEEYKRILEWNRISLAEFEESLGKEILLNKVVQLLTAGIAVTQEEIWENFKKQNESAKLEYLVLEKSKIELAAAPDEKDLQDYFEKNRDKYKIPERREGTYFFLRTEEMKKDIQVTDTEIEKYYKDNSGQFKIPERIAVSRIYIPFGEKQKGAVLTEGKSLLDKLRNGEEFSELAKRFSKDAKAQEGGNWGLFEWKTLTSKEQEKIRDLAEGQVSDILELEDGIALLKVTEKDTERMNSLEEVKDRIRVILEDTKARDWAKEKISNLEKSARKEKSLDVAAQKHGLLVKQTGLLKEGEAIQDIDPSGTLSQALFSLDEKGISSAVFTYEGVGIVQLEKKEDPHEAKLEEVKEDLEKDLVEAKKKSQILEKMTEARAKLDGKDWEEMAPKLNLEYKTVNEHKREQYLSIIGENEEFDGFAFTLPLNETSDPVEFENGYALLRVQERKEVSRKDLEKNWKEERDSLLERKKNLFLQTYLTKLREEKDAKINYNLFLKINADILSRFEGE